MYHSNYEAFYNKNKHLFDEDTIYASQDGLYFIILKLLNNSIDNEDRPNIKYPSTAMYRTDKAYVVKILNKFEDEEIFVIDNKLHYEEDCCVLSKFDMNLYRCNTDGIKYFKSPECAYYYELNNFKLTGNYKRWHENGQLAIETTIENGLLHGKCESYHNNGYLFRDVNFNKGKEDGYYFEYDCDGNLVITGQFKDGYEEGYFTYYEGSVAYTEYYEKGEKIFEQKYT